MDINYQKKENTLLIHPQELIFLLVTVLSICAQLVLGETNMISSFLKLIYAPGLIFFAGFYTWKMREQPRILLYKAGLYVLYFLGLGMCNQVLLNHNSVSQSFIKLLTLVTIPKPSEIFFTIAVLLFCAFFISRHLEQMLLRKRLLGAISVAALFLSLIPSHVFGYSIVGVFLGCDTYDCIPLVPYSIFYLAGIYLGSKEFPYKKGLLSCGVITLLSVLLASTPLRPVALITAAFLPVCVLYLISRKFRLYLWCVSLLVRIHLYAKDRIQILWARFLRKEKGTKPLYFLFYTLLFFIMSILIFAPFYENGRSIVWMQDAFTQYIPKAHFFISYVRDCIGQILNGNFNFPVYDFRIGMGNSISFSLDPVYWLIALFQPSDVETAYNFITLLRFYLAGISVSAFLLYFKRSYFETLFGSMMYTFCGFVLFAGALHSHFITPLILLPLMIIATEEIYRKGKWYFCTVIIAISLMASYYFLYMSTIAMGIYYLVRFLFTKEREKKTIKNFFSTTLTFAGSYILGAVIGNFSLFTSFASYLSSGRSSDASATPAVLLRYKETWPLKSFVSSIATLDSLGNWMKLGFTPFALIAVILLLARKGHHILKTLFLLGTMFCMFPVAAFVLSGFSSVTNRWGYIYALLITYISVWGLARINEISRRELKLIAIGILAYFSVVVIYREYRIPVNLVALAVLLCSYIVLLLANRKISFITQPQAKAALLALCCISLCVNSYYQYTIDDSTNYGAFAERGTSLEKIKDVPLSAASEIEDDSFYRVGEPSPSEQYLSSSLILGAQGLSVSSSTLGSPLVDYNTEMANTAWNTVKISGNNSRTFMDALACVKYYSVAQGDENPLPYGYEKLSSTSDGSYDIYKNNYALPLGYTYSDTISRSELEAYTPLEKQEIMLQSAIVEDNPTLEFTDTSDLDITSNELEITDFEASGLVFTEDTIEVLEEDATLTLYFDGVKNCETYLEFQGFLNPGKNSKASSLVCDINCGTTKRHYLFRSPNHTYATGQDQYLFNLGYTSDERTSCTLTFGGIGTMTYDSLKLYTQPMDNYVSYIEALKEDVLEDVTLSTNTVEGSISLGTDKLLALSIPYQKGWTAYVDGRETELERVNYMYTGLYLEAGDHEIRLCYERPGTKLSFILSGSGIVIFIAALIIRRRRIKIKR